MAEEKKQKNLTGEVPMVTFSPEQIALVDKMFDERLAAFKNNTERSGNPNAPISLYNMRDPKSIETVKVSRFDAKWVVGFKDLQNDPYKKVPKYLRYGVEPIRKLPNEPYVTLLLSVDGENVEEKEVLLLSYLENRQVENIKVVSIEVKDVIHDHGILGSVSQYGVAVDGKGNPEARPTILQQSKSQVRLFTVKLPVFDASGEVKGEFEKVYSTDFLG